MTLKILDEGREISLPTKTAEIVRAVVEISAEIELISSGHVTFNIKGRSIVPEVLRRFLPLREYESAKKE